MPMLALAWFKLIQCGSTHGRYFCFFYFISSHSGWMVGYQIECMATFHVLLSIKNMRKTQFTAAFRLQLFPPTPFVLHLVPLLQPSVSPPKPVLSFRVTFSHFFFLTSLTNSNQQILKGKFNYNKITSELQIFKAKLQTPSLCSRCRWTPACGFRKGRVSAGSRRHRFFVKKRLSGSGSCPWNSYLQ